jgi:hypothetical protein
MPRLVFRGFLSAFSVLAIFTIYFATFGGLGCQTTSAAVYSRGVWLSKGV